MHPELLAYRQCRVPPTPGSQSQPAHATAMAMTQPTVSAATQSVTPQENSNTPSGYAMPMQFDLDVTRTDYDLV